MTLLNHRAARLASTLLFALLGLSAPETRAAGCQITQAEMRVRIVDQRPIAVLKLNGTDVPLLVDTGATFSMLSPAAATQLGLPLRRLPPGISIEGYTGRIEAKLTTVDTVTLLGVNLNKVEFLVGGNALSAGIMGVLGRNFLSLADTEYDLGHGVVRLAFPKGDCEKTNFAHWAGDAPVIVVPMDRRQHRQDTAIRVTVSINGSKDIALLDSGAPHTALSLRTARRAGIQESDLTPEGRVGAGAGYARSWSGHVATFELGEQKISDSRLRIDDTDMQNQGMLLGLDYFLSHRIYVSRLQRQIYATWNGGPIFAFSRQTADERDTRFAAIPQNPSNDDADALARRGEAALASQNHVRALEDLNRACELAPTVGSYFFARARTHLGMRQLQLALADLDEALRLDAGLNDARLRRANLRAHLKDRAGAQSDLALLDTVLPPSSSLRATMASLHADFDQVPEALRQYALWTSTHTTDARLASVLNGRCWLRARMNIELPLALQDCKAATDKDDGVAAYRDSLGWVYLRLGDAERAKKAFDAALKMQPIAFSLYGRALAQLRLNDEAAADRDLAAARKLRPEIDVQARTAGFDFPEIAARSTAP